MSSSHHNNPTHIRHPTTLMPCFCSDCLHATTTTLFSSSSSSSSNPIFSNWYDHNHNHNVPTNSLTYQGDYLQNNPFSFSAAIDHHMISATNEVDSWLLLNPDDNDQDQTQIDLSTNYLNQYHPWSSTGNDYQYYQGDHQFYDHLQPQQVVNQYENYGMVSAQQQQQIILNSSQGIQNDFSRSAAVPAVFLNASLPQMVAGIVPDAAIGNFPNTMDLPGEWGVNQLSFLPFHHGGNLVDQTEVGNLSSIPSEATQQLSTSTSQTTPPMSRQERVQRYFEKKKARKYEKKIQYSSRRTYAQIRPRVRGRFISSQSQTDARTVIDHKVWSA